MPTDNVFIEQHATSERMTLPQFCSRVLALPEDSSVVRSFVGFIDAKCSRIEARGGTVEYPLRMSRFGWYAEWRAFEQRLESQEQAALRHGMA